MKTLSRVLMAVVLIIGALAAIVTIWPAASTDIALRAESRLAGLDRAVAAVDGHELVYYDNGGNGEPLVLIHGFGADHTNWMRMVAALDGDYRIIVPDLPGFGASTWLADADYGIGAQRDRVHALVQQLGLGRVHLAGNSMGGFISAAYAIRWPDEVRSIALLDAAGVDAGRSSEFMQALESGRNLLLTDSVEDFQRLLDFLFVERPWVPGFAIEVLAERHLARQARYAAIFDDVLASAVPLEQQVDSISTPALILWGDRDRVLSVDAVPVFEALLPNSSTVILPDTGHLPMLERPGDTARAYEAFLAGPTLRGAQ